MIYSLYRIKTKTNMHVGSGDTTFGVIDNLVQRDVVTMYPQVHSSSLKGALREFFKDKNSAIVTDIFGSDPKEQDKAKLKQGSYRFFDANLLVLPVRSSQRSFFRATTLSLIKQMSERLEDFNLQLKPDDKSALETLIESIKKIAEHETGFKPRTLDSLGTVYIEEHIAEYLDDAELTNAHRKRIKSISGSGLVIFNEEDFKNVSEELPVIARNQLENGESKNLWYEQIVPRESVFYCIIGLGEKHSTEFDEVWKDNLVQIGANATIGYGYTQFTKLI